MLCAQPVGRAVLARGHVRRAAERAEMRGATRLGHACAPTSRVGVGESVAVVEPLLMANADVDVNARLSEEIAVIVRDVRFARWPSVPRCSAR